MDRRAFLTSWLAAGVGLTAGCGALAESRSTVALEERAVSESDHGTRQRVTYGTAERAVLTLTIDQPIARASVTDEFRLAVRLAPREGLTAQAGEATVTQLRYRFRAPRAAASTPASIYVHPPTSDGRPPIETERTPDGWTTVSVAAPLEIRSLPVGIRTRVDPTGAEVDRVTLGVRARIEAADQVYSLSARTAFRPPVAPSVEPAPARGGGELS